MWLAGVRPAAEVHFVRRPERQRRMTQAERNSRTVHAVGAWIVLAAIVLGYISTIPAVDSAIGNPPPGTTGNILLTLVLVLFGVAGLVCWAGALWHASVNSRISSQANRVLLIIVLVICFFVGAFFYYFGYALWLRAQPRGQAA